MIRRIITSLIVLVVTTILFMWLEMKIMESGYIEQKIVDIDGNKFLMPTFVMRKSDPKKIAGLGNKLVCESFREVMGQPVEKNKYFSDVKSMVSKKGTYVDCFEPKTNVAIDYLGRDYYNYKGPSYFNSDVYDFYNRIAIDESKKEKLEKKGYNYIQVPYKIDQCVLEDEEYVCDPKTPDHIRKERLKEYIREVINIS